MASQTATALPSGLTATCRSWAGVPDGEIPCAESQGAAPSAAGAAASAATPAASRPVFAHLSDQRRSGRIATSSVVPRAGKTLDILVPDARRPVTTEVP